MQTEKLQVKQQSLSVEIAATYYMTLMKHSSDKRISAERECRVEKACGGSTSGTAFLSSVLEVDNYIG